MSRPKRVLMFLVDGFDPAYVQPAGCRGSPRS